MSKNVQKTSGNKELTSQQLKAIELLVDYDNDMTYGDIASEVGVSERTLWQWRNRNDDFIEKKKQLSERGLIEKVDKVNQALVDGAIEGNSQLIKLFYERVGLYSDSLDLNHSGSLQHNFESMSDDELLKEAEKYEINIGTEAGNTAKNTVEEGNTQEEG